MSSKKKVTKTEVRWSLHLTNRIEELDYHYVKFQRTFEDGTTDSSTTLIRDFERKVWVKKASYTEKREFESREGLIERSCTESQLNMTAANLLGEPHLVNQPGKIKDSPHIYGYDISSTTFLKHKSLKANNNVQSAYTVAAFDIETTTCEEKFIHMATLTMKKGDHYEIYTGATNEYLNRRTNFQEQLLKSVDKYLPQYKGKLKINVKGFNTVTELLTYVFREANRLAPDFLSIWNQRFDIKTCIAAIEREGNDIRDVFCDPSVPKSIRKAHFREGITRKVMASGKVMPLAPSAQWHVFTCTAKFLVMDSMCVYRQLRLMDGELTSYALDDVLEHELGTRKLTFTEADGYVKERWHNFMTANYPVEYMVYNFYDTIALLELDEKTTDLSMRLPSFSGSTDFWRFNSQSRKLADALFWFGLEEKDLVLGAGGSFKEEDEIPDDFLENDEEDGDDGEERVEDFKVLSLNNWIMLLPQSNLVPNQGLKLFEDVPYIQTNIRGLTSDADAVSSYPSCTFAANVSKETTVCEVIEVIGVPEEVFRQQNLAICLGEANMLEYFEVMFDLPGVGTRELDRWLDANI